MNYLNYVSQQNSNLVAKLKESKNNNILSFLKESNYGGFQIIRPQYLEYQQQIDRLQEVKDFDKSRISSYLFYKKFYNQQCQSFDVVLYCNNYDNIQIIVEKYDLDKKSRHFIINQVELSDEIIELQCNIVNMLSNMLGENIYFD